MKAKEPRTCSETFHSKECETLQPSDGNTSTLLALPEAVLVEKILTSVDGRTLCRFCTVRKGLSTLTERAAELSLQQQELTLPRLFRRKSSRETLAVLQCVCGLHAVGNDSFHISQDSNETHVTLTAPGPKLLLSDKDTTAQPYLRWRVSIEGNAAIEFGVVPLLLLEDEVQKLSSVPCGLSTDKKRVCPLDPTSAWDLAQAALHDARQLPGNPEVRARGLAAACVQGSR
eukprot:CAMPEP_0177585466 /NCGR_PEP_ID=MMETSP0419_2-20121207/4508_1 /TAXON_ID=582737 /ORGANISM="Tetraselmis sp., Strain GSL018" /LENGTH=229 /DNA_ID=CAMNT_0019075201 /DNA_START=147 /DNA_END=833 /DNA_ORIENTATION=+